MKIAFIGLGNMGGPMAMNLLKAGHSLSAFDLSADACGKFAAEGLPIANSAADTLEDAEVVISMLPASAHVEALYLGANGLMDKIAAGTLVIDSSTIAAATSRKVAEAGAEPGLIETVRGVGYRVTDAPSALKEP